MTQTIADYMTRYPYTADVSMTFNQAREIMLRFGVRHLPVLERDTLLGIVTERDIAMAERASAGRKTLGEVALERVYAVDLKTPLDEVARRLAESRISSAVVLDRGKVAGIFTTRDACRALADALRK